MNGLWSVALRAALDAFSSLGIDSRRICCEAGIDSRALDDPDARIPLERGAKIWPLAEKQWGLPGLGLEAGSAVTFGKLGALDYVLVNAGTVGAALDRWETYWEVVTAGRTGLRVELSGKPRRYSVTFLGYEHPHLRDYALTATAQRLRWMGVSIESATVSGAVVAPERDYSARLGCSVSLHGDATRFFLQPGAETLRLPDRVPGLGNLVDREINRLIETAHAGTDSLVRLRHALIRSLGPSSPTLDDVASRMGVSRRQLQRALSARGTSFTAVLDLCRREVAEQLLAGRATSIEEVGYLVGYADGRAFSRAFRRWNGMTPSAFRAQSLLKTR